MAIVFASAGILCSLGTGNMAQSNSIADALKTNYSIPVYVTGVIITILVLLVIIGGIKRIAEVTSKLVPFMAVFYFLAAIIIIVMYIDKIPSVFAMILHDAFAPKAATGGFIGSTFLITLKYGVARGLFSNEAGQGSAAIAHAAAKTEHPMREGLVASVGPMIDTLIICTMTALVIILTGSWSNGIEGVGMTVAGFTAGLGKLNLAFLARHVVTGGLILFAFSTIIAWSYYGTRTVEYLFGSKMIKPYRYVYGLFVLLGALGKIEIVWNFVDMVITFMTIPNLIAIMLLTPVIKKEIKDYFSFMKAQKL
jgi:AGCS family alanine or glycine:cation symporter